jgi:hypothetical protein
MAEVNAVTSMRTIAVGHDVSTRELITIPPGLKRADQFAGKATVF